MTASIFHSSRGPRRVEALTFFLLLIGFSAAFQVPSVSHVSARQIAEKSTSSQGLFDHCPATTRSRRGHPLMYRDRDATEEAVTGFSRRSNRHSSSSINALQNPMTQAQSSFGEITKSAVNLPLVRSICRSQLVAFAATFTLASLAFFLSHAGPVDLSSIHWNWGIEYQSLLNWKVTPWRLLEGVLGTIPLIAMGGMVENSASRKASHISFSVTNTVISLFGRRRKPEQAGESSVGPRKSNESTSSTFQVALFSIGISTISALTQELVYRGLVPVVIVAWTHSVPLALVGQAVLYGLGQVHANSSFDENSVFSAMHVSTGLWYGALYLAAGGDILPVILAHILYDSHVFVEAWARINHQMEWCEKASPQKLSAEDEQDLENIRQEAGGSLAPETLGFCRRFFYAFDYDHQGSLSLPDVQRAVAYAFLHDSDVPSQAKVETAFIEMVHHRCAKKTNNSEERADEEKPEERLSLPEFLRLLFALKSKNWRNQMI